MDALTIVAKLLLDSKDYDKGIDGAKKGASGLGSAFDRLKANISGVSQNLTAHKNQVSVLKAQYGDAKDNVKKLTTEFNAAAKETGTTSEKTRELAQKLKDAQREADNLGKEYDELSGKSDVIEKLKGGFSTFGKIAAKATAAAAAGVAFLTKNAVESYAEYEQLEGGVKTLFSNLDETVSAAPKVLENAANAYKTAGMSANQYMETVTSFSAALVSSLNGDYAKAADISDMAISDMADNANKMGTSMEAIQNAYQGFAKQNYTIELMSVA